MRTRDEIIYAFTPQEKLGPVQKAALQRMDTAFKELATDVLDNVPETADRTSALRKILEAKMMCSQAITHPPTEKKQTVITRKADINAKEETADATNA